MLNENELSLKVRIAKLYRKFGIVVIFAVIIIVASLLSKAFLTPNNALNVLRQITLIAIVACGEQMIIINGDIDLSPGSVMALSGCVAADIMVKTNSVVIAALAGICIGLACGWLNGFIVVKFKIPAFIMTLATQSIMRGATLAYTNAKPISNLGDFTVFGQGYIGPIPVMIAIMAICIAVTWTLLNKMRFGRYLYAVGGNVGAAKASGINVGRTRLLAFLYGGIMAGITGIILASRMNSGQPTMGANYEFDAITAVVIGGASLSGGVGNVFGMVVGALIIGVLNNIMTLMGVSSYYQQIAQGTIIAIAVITDVKVRSLTKK